MLLSDVAIFCCDTGCGKSCIQPVPVGSGADLRHADLSGTDSRDADLSRANLVGVDLRDAYLRGANLSGAALFYEDLRGAPPEDADLRGATLVGIRGRSEAQVRQVARTDETTQF
jgi:uncharacterized protein YjbI with pentapeptide repeats